MAFLLTDIVGSTQRFVELGEAWRAVLDLHDEIVAGAVVAAGGWVLRSEGDSIFAAFGDARSGLCAAVDAQRGLRDAAWDGPPVRVRMGLHRGTAERRQDDYISLALHQAARVSSVAGPAQILCTDVVASGVRDRLPADVVLADLGRFWLKDLAEPLRLWGVEIDGDSAGLARPRAVSALTDLPIARSTFVGRDEEVRRVGKSLLMSALTTITGPGGAGKTRLALAAAAEAPDMPATFVDLTVLDSESGRGSPATDAVALAALQALGWTSPVDAPPVDALAERMLDQPVLLLLDGCEHVRAGATEVCAALLRSVTEPRILTTSRAPLDLDGEEVIALGPLELADGDGEEVRMSPAFRLLAERARQARRGEPVADDELALLVPALRSFDPLPLTIELLAARLRTLRAEDLVTRLDRPLDLLAASAKATPRHRSLRDVIEWSTSLLPPTDQLVLQRASVFVGRPDIADLEAVAAGGVVRSEDVLDTLGRLVSGSLAGVDETGCVVVPVPVRAWAAEGLAAAGEESVTADRHLERMASVATSEPARVAGPLLADAGAALRHAASSGAADLAARLVVHAGPLMMPESTWRTIWRAAADALDDSAVPAPRREVVEAQVVVSRWAVRAGDPSIGGKLARAAADRARDLGDDALLASAHLALATVAAAIDEPDTARAALAEAEQAAAGADELTRLRVRKTAIGLLKVVPAQEQVAALRDLLPRVERAGDEELLLDTQFSLASLLATLVDDDGPAAVEARDRLDSLLDSGVSQLGTRERARLRSLRSRVAWYQGDRDTAHADLADGIELAAECGDDIARAMLRDQAAALAAADGLAQEAVDLYEEVLGFAIRRAPYWIDDMRAAILRISIRRRDVARVRRHLDEVERVRPAERVARRLLTFELARTWLRLHLDPSGPTPVDALVEAADAEGVPGIPQEAFTALGPALAGLGRVDVIARLLRRAVADRRERDVPFTALTADSLALVAAGVGAPEGLLGRAIATADAACESATQRRLPEEAAAIDEIRRAAPPHPPPDGPLRDALLAVADELIALLEVRQSS